MPKISWGNVPDSTEGGFEKLPAGPYVVRVVSARYDSMKNYTEVVYDIAEGEHAGYYSDAWGQTHPFAHRFFMSYKDKALSMTKWRLNSFTESNPGFDAMAASDADRFDLFTGRIVGVNIQEEEYEYNGEVKTRMTVCEVWPAQAVRDGKVKPKGKKKLDGSEEAKQSAQPYQLTADDIDVPF